MKSMDNIPFPPSKKTKVDYMWRDIERRAASMDCRYRKPAPYPLQEFDRANLVGIVMNNQGRYLDYFEATYRCWFLDGLEAGSDDNLAKVFDHLGMPLDEVLQAAAADEVQAAYAQTTAEARTKAFSVPRPFQLVMRFSGAMTGLRTPSDLPKMAESKTRHDAVDGGNLRLRLFPSLKRFKHC